MLSVIYAECPNQAHYAECRYLECRYAECRYTECRYAECRGAKNKELNEKMKWGLDVINKIFLQFPIFYKKN